MTLAAVLGQERAVGALRAGLRAKALHHAWLFAGPEGVGKELAAVGLAQALVCTERRDEGCGTCAACLRAERRNHPDVQWVLPEDEAVRRGFAGRSDFAHVPSKEIRVEQVRRLQERLALRALEGPHKVVLVLSAHAMNAAAQNALLKTLEEPPAGTVLVLVTASADRLLPTIRSRCAKARFGPLPRELLVRELVARRGVDTATAEAAAAMAGGSLGRVLELDVAALTARREVIAGFDALRESDARGWLQLAERWGEDRGAAEAALGILEVWLRDVAVAQVGGGALVNADLGALAAAAAARVSPMRLLRWRELVAEATAAVVYRHGSPRLQLERLFVEALWRRGEASR